MEFVPSRLRAAELIAAGAAVALLVLMLALHWYGSRSGWQALTVWRWVALVSILTGLALAYFQAARRAPAVPAVLSVALSVIGLLNLVWLAFDVVLSHPAHQRFPAVLGLLAAGLLLYGGFTSLRREGISPRDAPSQIPTVTTGREVPS
jgi:hypothetical protein